MPNLMASDGVVMFGASVEMFHERCGSIQM